MSETHVALSNMRVSYEAGELDETSLAGTWHEQLRIWFDQAVEAGLTEPNAMVLATADSEGVPSSRTVLCKGFDERGLVFFTNYTSAKSHDLTATRVAAVTFPWLGLQRQVNIRGSVEKVSQHETAEYWQLRPRGSQLGAWASPQSRVVANREALETSLQRIERRFGDAEKIPVPPHWGGWRLLPESVEFWQGRPSRLHDRLRFRRTEDNGWIVERLAP
ncbi:pyridoxamine 5'-phosphate oxidase [Saccharopolyspora rectivirgula]|jgi:pyridoxamine 5'-phosphate oxidase|uniref:Pyridoxine/pyridoxamine 5'-phosphate oxidase n=1 Tax=Saccharopolyspora rectivirgula TaxID=28042 RepID=A0A073B1I2_9PSEU|nr:pyridoxamine 5'-phosphate oxidase [Saccharopolyspora rectivirgula]KEI45480.1 pyridoxamine 5'-phosphate oxidase [Saccharopolyspora rectivirgula]